MNFQIGKRAFAAIFAMGLLSSGLVRANSELDDQVANGKLPAAVVVRVDQKGQATVFSTSMNQKVSNDDQARIIASSLKDENALPAVKSTELDQTSSDQACVYWNYSSAYYYNYGVSYYSYGSNYWYSPCYSYNYGNYSYYYYWYRY